MMLLAVAQTENLLGHKTQNLLKQTKKKDQHEHHMDRNHPRLSETQVQKGVAGEKTC